MPPSVARWLEKIDADLEQAAAEFSRQLPRRERGLAEEAMAELVPLACEFEDLPEDEQILLAEELRHYGSACKAGFMLAIVNFCEYLDGDGRIAELIEWARETKTQGDRGRETSTERSERTAAEARRLSKQKKKPAQIAKELGISRQHVYRLTSPKPKSRRR